MNKISGLLCLTGAYLALYLIPVYLPLQGGLAAAGPPRHAVGIDKHPLPSLANVAAHEEVGDDFDEFGDLPDAAHALRRDPCEHLPDPPGRARGIERHCPRPGGGNGVAKGDFNGDGFADLAIGVPGEDIRVTGSNGSVTNVVDAGAVVIIYGTANGLNATGSTGAPAAQFWSQSSSGVPGSAETGDRFGAALAAGNFNGDAYSDLAIGAPGDAVSRSSCPFGLFCTPRDTGAVIVIYGSAQGLSTSAGNAPNFLDLLNFREAWAFTDDPGGSALGSALAWGDFDGNGVGDLVVGAPRYSSRQATVFGNTNLNDIGGVLIIRGVAGTGLTTDGHQFWIQEPLAGASEPDDRFGSALAVGDFNGDGRPDLAIGVPGEDLTGGSGASISAAGAVSVIYNAGSGLAVTGNQGWNRNATGLCCADSGDQFGASLAAGDFNGDGSSDLAIGVPFDDVGTSRGTVFGAGSVDVLYGSTNRLTATGRQRFEQQTATRVLGTEASETDDHFGRALTAGDFNADGKADLAIGAPDEDVRSGVTNTNLQDAGMVHVLYGRSGDGLNRGAGPGAQVWTSETLGRGLEVGDRFGASLTAWNFGRNQLIPGLPPRIVATADLAIGAPNEDVIDPVTQNPVQIGDAGAVFTIYGSTNGLTGAGNQVWLQGYDGVPDLPEAGDRMGEALY